MPVALAAILLFPAAGCGSAKDDPAVATAGSGATATADPAERARQWADCMRSAGVTLTRNAEGQDVVDKDKNAAQKVAEASERCREHAPVVAPSDQRVTEEDLARLREYASCMREHGITEYADPDPVTGRTGEEAVVQRRGKYDRQLQDAITACQPKLGGTGDGHVGG